MELFVCKQVNFWVKYYWFFTKYLLNISLIPCAENKRFFAQYLVTMKFLQPAHPLFLHIHTIIPTTNPNHERGENLCKNICQKNLISLIEHAYSLPPSPSNLFFLYSDLMKIWILNCTIILLLKNIFFNTNTLQ